MKKKRILKKLLAFCLALVCACNLPVTTASAKNGYPDVDMFAHSLLSSGETYKGLQGAEKWDEFGGVSHSLWNIFLDECIFPSYRSGCTKYEFEGETFYFGTSNLLNAARLCNQYEMTFSVVVLLRWDGSDETAFLVEEGSRDPGHTYYAPATTGYGGKAMRAFWQFIMEKLAANSLHVDNFILGNEVNMPNQWHYSGSTDPETVASKYAAAFYDMYSTVRKFSDSARCSICVDHSWNNNDEGRGIAARDMLNRFNDNLQKYEPDIDWCISTHLYPAMLYNTEIWTEPYGLNPIHPDARIIDARNLSVMTNYVRDVFGEEHRIMLTEQGFTDECGANAQAACLAYSYYAAKYDPMVDCFILSIENAGIADTGEGLKSLNFDIRGTLAEEVYRRIDGPEHTDEDTQWVADVCLPVIGVDSWDEIIPYYGQETKASGFIIDNGVGKMYKNGEIDTSYNGWYTYNGIKYLLKAGVAQDIPTANKLPDNYNGWYTKGSNIYWMDNGVTAGDKEVYDPTSDAWYWFDADGTMAVSKDAFIPTNAERTEGKWVRYDENGAMAKGEDFANGNWYRFDYVTGEMIKGWYTEGDTSYYYDDQWGTKVYGGYEIEGVMYKFNETTGISEGIANLTWCSFDGKEYWYEGGVRQGYDPDNKDGYRGKEVFDPASDAWYWLDNVQDGAKAISKDVYQESLAGEWGDDVNENGERIGKWVRYDENGHMVKGWQYTDAGTYYFDWTYGTMAKGNAVIDGETYYFDPNTGILQE